MIDTGIPLAGMRCLRVDGPGLAAVRAVVPGGARSESVAGVCVLTGRMLEEGTVRSSWRELAGRVEAAGMEIVSFGDYDGHGVAVDCLARDVASAVEITAEVLSQSRFPEDRLDLVRSQEEQSLRAVEESPEAATGWAFLDAIYEGERRGIPLQGRPGDLARVTVEDCRRFHLDGVSEGVILVLTGDIDEEQVHPLVERYFAPSEAGVRCAGDASPQAVSAPGSATVELATGASEQAHVYLGHRTVVRADEDRLALVVLGTILGGGAGNSGRVPERIREELGLAYSTYAGLASGAGLDPGHVVLYAGTASVNVAAVARELRRELCRLIEEPVTRAELAGAVNFILGREPFRRETGRQWASRLIEEELYGLRGRSQRLGERLAEMTPEGLLEVAARWIRADALRMVVGRPGG